MTYTTDIDTPIQQFIAMGSGMDRSDVIPGNDKGPRPTKLYATLLWLDGEPVRSNPTPTFTTIETEDVFSVQWYRTGALAAARRFVVWALSDLALLEQLRRGFRIRPPLALRNLDYVVSDRFEERVGLDLRVGWCYAISEDSGNIESTGGLDLMVEP